MIHLPNLSFVCVLAMDQALQCIAMYIYFCVFIFFWGEGGECQEVKSPDYLRAEHVFFGGQKFQVQRLQLKFRHNIVFLYFCHTPKIHLLK